MILSICMCKKQTNRKRNVPSGPSRFDSISKDWVDILEETSKPVESKKKKASAKETQEKKGTKKKPIRN